jgi:uncharacterized protein YukE
LPIFSADPPRALLDDLHSFQPLLDWLEGANPGVSMSKAIVDPAELRRFAHNLKHFNNELQHQLAVLQGQFAGLGDTWRDQEHERFGQQFAEAVQVLARFMEASQQQIPYLLRKAERIEEYLQQR